MKKLSKTQNKLLADIIFIAKCAAFFVDSDEVCKVVSKGIVNVHYTKTLTLKAMEKKGYLKILKFATAKDRRHYMTAVQINEGLMLW